MLYKKRMSLLTSLVVAGFVSSSSLASASELISSMNDDEVEALLTKVTHSANTNGNDLNKLKEVIKDLKWEAVF